MRSTLRRPSTVACSKPLTWCRTSTSECGAPVPRISGRGRPTRAWRKSSHQRDACGIYGLRCTTAPPGAGLWLTESFRSSGANHTGSARITPAAARTRTGPILGRIWTPENHRRGRGCSGYVSGSSPDRAAVVTQPGDARRIDDPFLHCRDAAHGVSPGSARRLSGWCCRISACSATTNALQPRQAGR